MSRKVERIPFPFSHQFDEVIDVRSPSEFSDDHLEGAINLPVLSDEERAEVGTVYRQISPFEARKLGAALVTARIAEHLKSHFLNRSREHEVLLYCWRGGQRSGSFALVLAEVGWRVCVLEGGYKAYRKQVIKETKDFAEALTFHVINGYTGSGKTLILGELAKQGAQVLDLEALANHRGSLFGGFIGGIQPSQKRFESLLYEELGRFDSSRPVFVEAESPKIGALYLPVGFWRSLQKSQVVEIAVPLDVRARYVVDSYEAWCRQPERVAMAVSQLRTRHSRVKITLWTSLVEAEDWVPLVRSLLEEHYDPSYGQNGTGYYSQPQLRICLADHSEKSVEGAARAILSGRGTDGMAITG